MAAPEYAESMACKFVTRLRDRLRSALTLADDPFERLVERTERLAALPPAPRELDEFELLVQHALDRLPDEFQRIIETVPVVVSDGGAREHAYGQYYGDGVARGHYEDRIMIYRDTLVKDFGHDADLLAAQVERTVRHEIAHHLGWDEPGVQGLGL